MQNLATIFDKLLHLLGCHTGNFPPRAREKWEIICFDRHQEIYRRIALLAYDEPITTLRDSVEMTGTQNRYAQLLLVPPKKFFFWRLFMESGRPVNVSTALIVFSHINYSRVNSSNARREITMVTWVWGLKSALVLLGPPNHRHAPHFAGQSRHFSSFCRIKIVKTQCESARRGHFIAPG